MADHPETGVPHPDRRDLGRRGQIVALVTLLGSAALRVLGILLEQPALSWAALAVALTGVTILVVRLVRRLRQLRRRSE